MSTDDRIEQARLLYERAVFGGDPDAPAAAGTVLDAVEADLALARGRLLHARFLEQRTEDPLELELFQRATRLYQELGDLRGEGEARCWLGILHQVVRDDDGTAVPLLERSLELATAAGDDLTRSYALRHLGIAQHRAGRLEAARARLEESVELRRALGFRPGVAANLVGLAYIASAQGRRSDALALLAEADGLAAAASAHALTPTIAEARTHVGS
jgi:tetratricopeptide (TPR) repeat protein